VFAQSQPTWLREHRELFAAGIERDLSIVDGIDNGSAPFVKTLALGRQCQLVG